MFQHMMIKIKGNTRTHSKWQGPKNKNKNKNKGTES